MREILNDTFKDEIKKSSQFRHGEGSRKYGTTPEYLAWCMMRQRCYSKQMKDYPRYGGRGIVVCKRWDKYENFLEDMGRKPSPTHSLDRKDVNGNYTKSNCRWATFLEQQNNTTRNVFVVYNGQQQTLSQLARLLNVSRSRLQWYIRDKGKSVDEAVALVLKKQTKLK